MAAKLTEGGKYLVDIQRKNIPRVRRSFDNRKEAEIFEREYLTKHGVIRKNGVDQRTLRELINLWFMYHGINLTDGERRKTKLLYLCSELNNPVANQLTAGQFVKYRYQKTYLNDKLITAKTFNNIHGYLSAVYSKLNKLKVIDYVSPIAAFDFIEIHERQLSYCSQVMYIQSERKKLAYSSASTSAY